MRHDTSGETQHGGGTLLDLSRERGTNDLGDSGDLREVSRSTQAIRRAGDCVFFERELAYAL